jgi:hypothetical protein
LSWTEAGTRSVAAQAYDVLNLDGHKLAKAIVALMPQEGDGGQQPSRPAQYRVLQKATVTATMEFGGEVHGELEPGTIVSAVSIGATKQAAGGQPAGVVRVELQLSDLPRSKLNGGKPKDLLKAAMEHHKAAVAAASMGASTAEEVAKAAAVSKAELSLGVF